MIFTKRQLELINVIMKYYVVHSDLFKDNADENGMIIDENKEIEIIPDSGLTVSYKELKDIRILCKKAVLEKNVYGLDNPEFEKDNDYSYLICGPSEN